MALWERAHTSHMREQTWKHVCLHALGPTAMESVHTHHTAHGYATSTYTTRPCVDKHVMSHMSRCTKLTNTHGSHTACEHMQVTSVSKNYAICTEMHKKSGY